MPAYRFYRPEDVPKLARGVEACWRPYFPQEPEMTPERFRREMKVLDLWPSSCMMATEGDEAIAIVVGAKRATETAVLRVATRPGHERRGHASHVLASLRQKLAVLGPPRLVAEVPRHLAPATALFASLGWQREAAFVDLLLPAGADGDAPAVAEVPAAQLLELAAPSTDAAWLRRRETLVGGRDFLRGLVLAGPHGPVAWLLAFDDPVPVVVAHGVEDPSRSAALLAAFAAAGPLRFVRLPADDPAVAALLSLGAVVEAEVDRWAVSATVD